MKPEKSLKLKEKKIDADFYFYERMNRNQRETRVIQHMIREQLNRRKEEEKSRTVRRICIMYALLHSNKKKCAHKQAYTHTQT